jgi:DNA mismatch repair ATPase MutS
VKAYLMHRDRDFDLEQPSPPHADDLIQDLELERLFAAMAAGDRYLYDVARKGVLASLTQPAEILYRQQVLGDCLAHPAVIRGMYALAVEAIEKERKVYRSFLTYPDAVLHRGVEVLELFVPLLKRLRRTADEQAAAFRSEGFGRLFAELRKELADEYFARVEEHLHRLRLDGGALVSARLGKGGKGVGYVLRKPRTVEPLWRHWLASLTRESPYTVVIAERDEAGMQALTELRGRGIDAAANALHQSCDHILAFFAMLRAELGFYVGCLNVHERLTAKGEPLCVPEPLPPGRPALAGRGLYDACLSLGMEGRVVGNDVDADGKCLVMITGANRGGKSTFLRSLGLAQLMMQAGMFVAAEAFRADTRAAIFSHFRREEDATMTSGKFDEELARMSAIVDRLPPGALVLFNESFSATNEREGAEIGHAVVRALLEVGVKVCFVTHSFELAHGLHTERRDDALFLRAERRADGTRTFKLIEGEPLPTSFGPDLYRRIFGSGADGGSTAPVGEGGIGPRPGQHGATPRNL